jgi:glycyl-tRNA synthetase beta chain
MAELLLELLSEEIPARMQAEACRSLAGGLRQLLIDHGLPEPEIETFATPRRLSLVARALPPAQPSRTVERRGPRVGAPEAALDGFRRSLGPGEHEIGRRIDSKAEYWYATLHQPGRPTRELLAEGLPTLLARFPWPKSMRWGSGDVVWVRPLRAIVCLLDREVVPFRFGPVESGQHTVGHRFLAPAQVEVRDFADYRAKLLEARVLLDLAERRRRIEDGARALAATAGLRLRHDPALLDEVAGLVEWPVPLLGRIDRAFMDIPAEVLVLTMRQNQKYLALETDDGRLADRFVVVANIEAPDGGAAIVAGNERVLRARFWDARHFWELDRRTPLESLLPRLDRMVFHAELGSQAQRVQRLVALTGALVPHVPGADRVLAERAALLAKADLVSGMVGEFPELQGVMGGHYARAQGEPEPVANAIAEHYSPKGPDDWCPRAPESVALALADRIDTLVGFFARGIRPTGSKDPFALRRAALGLIRLVLDNRLRLPLRSVIEAAARGHGVTPPTPDLLAFLGDRLKVHLRERGMRHDLVGAVFALGDDDLVRLLARVDALHRLMGTADGHNLLVGYLRASNIVGIEEKRDGRSYAASPDPRLLREPAERELYARLQEAVPRIKAAVAREDFDAAMRLLAGLRGPIDAFFEQILVNAMEPELRVNRLALLSGIRTALDQVADFSLIEEVAA